MKLIYADDVLEIHEYILLKYKGSGGVRDLSLLESAVGRLSSGYHDNIYSAAAALLQSLVLNHAFIDGNKRTAYASLEYFLHLNGLTINASDLEIENFLIDDVIKNKILVDEIALWISNHSN